MDELNPNDRQCGYFRRINETDAEHRPAFCGVFSDDEVENIWAQARYDEKYGELYLGED